MDRYLTTLSQFSYINGENSCTYISLEACIRILSSNIVEHSYIHNPTTLSQLIEEIIVCGVAIDQGKGHRSADETISSNERLSNLLEIEKFFIAKLKNERTCMQLLRELEVAALTNSNKKVCCVLTKPPETICIGHISNKDNALPFDFFIFDSHPRGMMSVYEHEGIFTRGGNKGPGNGAGFYFFKNIQCIERYLKRLFPNQTVAEYQNDYKFDEYHSHAHTMFEATIVSLKDQKSVTPPVELQTNRPVLHQQQQQQQQKQQQQPQLQQQIRQQTSDSASNSALRFLNSLVAPVHNITTQSPSKSPSPQQSPRFLDISGTKSQQSDQSSVRSTTPSPTFNNSSDQIKLKEENEALKNQVQSLQLQLATQFDTNKKLRVDVEALGSMLRKLAEENKELTSQLNANKIQQ